MQQQSKCVMRILDQRLTPLRIKSFSQKYYWVTAQLGRFTSSLRYRHRQGKFRIESDAQVCRHGRWADWWGYPSWSLTKVLIEEHPKGKKKKERDQQLCSLLWRCTLLSLVIQCIFLLRWGLLHIHLPLCGRNSASSTFLLNCMSQTAKTKGGRPVSLTVNFKSLAWKGVSKHHITSWIHDICH